MYGFMVFLSSYVIVTWPATPKLRDYVMPISTSVVILFKGRIYILQYYGWTTTILKSSLLTYIRMSGKGRQKKLVCFGNRLKVNN